MERDFLLFLLACSLLTELQQRWAQLHLKIRWIKRPGHYMGRKRKRKNWRPVFRTTNERVESFSGVSPMALWKLNPIVFFSCVKVRVKKWNISTYHWTSLIYILHHLHSTLTCCIFILTNNKIFFFKLRALSNTQKSSLKSGKNNTKAF